MQIGVEFGHHFARFEPLAVGRQALDPAGHHVHQGQVFFNGRQHVGPQDFDGDFTPAGQHRKVHLGNGGTGHRRLLKTGKNTVQRPAESALDDGDRHSRFKRRHAVLQACQFIGDIQGQQIAPRGHDLAELHKNRT